MLWLCEAYEHGPEDVERLGAVVAAMAAAPPRNELVVTTAEDTPAPGAGAPHAA